MRSAIASLLCFVTTACGSGVIEGGPFEVLDEVGEASSAATVADIRARYTGTFSFTKQNVDDKSKTGLGGVDGERITRR